MFELHTIQGTEQWKIPLISGELLIVGRGDVCDIQLEDPSVSRIHCRILVRDGAARLYDSGSRWGTFINGEPIAEETVINAGDKIEIGNSTLTLVALSSPSTTTIAPCAAKNKILGFVDDSPAVSFGQLEKVVLPQKIVAFQPEREGTLFLNYQIERIIASTRKGIVYLATDNKNKTTVALKLFDTMLFQAEREKQRFLRAAKTMISLTHENLITLLDAGEDEGVLYAASKFVEGESVHQMIQRIGIAGMLDWRKVLQIGIDLTQALCYLAEQKIVHRNILPTNVIIRSEDNKALLGDVLLSKAFSGENASPLTQASELIGELTYLSPEQVSTNQPVDHRSDIYNLGVMLYVLSTGRVPFNDNSPPILIAKILAEPPVSPKEYNLSIAPLFEGILLRMLEKHPENRYQTPQELFIELEQVIRYSD